MEKIFEESSRNKLRFESQKGLLVTEDLWDLSLTDLNNLAKSINKELKTIEEEDFLKGEAEGDINARLGFKIVIHILETKKAEKKKRLDDAQRKVQKEKILRAIERKKDDALGDMSVEDLEKTLNDL